MIAYELWEQAMLSLFVIGLLSQQHNHKKDMRRFIMYSEQNQIFSNILKELKTISRELLLRSEIQKKGSSWITEEIAAKKKRRSRWKSGLLQMRGQLQSMSMTGYSPKGFK